MQCHAGSSDGALMRANVIVGAIRAGAMAFGQ